MDDITNVTLEPMTKSEYIKPYRVSYTQNGIQKTWDCTQNHDSVAILLHNISRDVFIFVKQFRPAVYVRQAKRLGYNGNVIDTVRVPGHLGVTHELCAGIVDKTCSLAKQAKNEVMEECGYDVSEDKLVEILTCRGNIGISGTQQTLFYAQVTDSMRTGHGGGLAEEGEFIETVEVPTGKCLETMMGNDMETSIGLLFALAWYKLYKQDKVKLQEQNDITHANTSIH